MPSSLSNVLIKFMNFRIIGHSYGAIWFFDKIISTIGPDLPLIIFVTVVVSTVNFFFASWAALPNRSLGSHITNSQQSGYPEMTPR